MSACGSGDNPAGYNGLKIAHLIVWKAPPIRRRNRMINPENSDYGDSYPDHVQRYDSQSLKMVTKFLCSLRLSCFGIIP